MEKPLEKPTLGLMPRLLAAGWFALAASLPVGFLQLLFGWLSVGFEERWMFGVLPIVTAAYFGLTLGATILSPDIDSNFKAIKRGLQVAFGSYVTLMALVAIVMTIANFPPRGSENFVNPLGVLPLFGIGLLFVGWLVALAGSIAGWLLFRISPSLEYLLSDSLKSYGLKGRTSRLAALTGLLLLLASIIPPCVSMRASRKAELRERRNNELSAAASRGDVTALRGLLDEGAEVEAGDNAGWTSIIHAARGGHNEVVQLLLQHGANPNVVENGNQNMTPLHWAATSNNIDGVRMLLENGADVNRSTTNGYTALMLAANNASPQLVQLLLNYKPNLDLRNDEGQTALAFAKARRSKPSLTDSQSNERYTDPIAIEKARIRHDKIIHLLEAAEAVK
jgi:hypothetical protein